MNVNFDDTTLNADISVDNVTDTESGVKDVYAELYTSAEPDNKIRKDLTADEYGTWKLPQFNAYSLFKSDDSVIDVVLEDNVGNTKVITNKYDLFTVSAQIVSYNYQSFTGIPTLLKGQDAILEIYTTGSPTSLQITFPDELSTLDNTLNKALTIEAKDYLATPYEFKIPLDMQDNEGDYTVNVKAIKGDKSRETNALMHVTDNILNGIRTRTRSADAP